MKKNLDFLNNYYNDIGRISNFIDKNSILKLVLSIKKIRDVKKGRIFFLGVGGSAGNSSHAVNDFRKICQIESYTPLDNVSELTARINDEGWETSLVNWLKISNLSKKDAIFIFSVGGGDIKKKISVNLIEAAKFAKKKKAKVFGVVGKKEGYVAQHSDNVIIIPEVNKIYVTPYSESYQAVIWHSIVSHPLLQKNKTKW
jgi:D-sedoheptulose 7-phosphate isomerase